MQSMRRTLSILFFAIVFESFSQAKFPHLSPAGSISQQVGFTTIFIQYERPAARGRKIFGDLVPYDKVWRTGAGKCTRITIGDPVLINQKKIDAGTYALFTIPGENEWTIILNSDTSLYGAGRYDSAKDVVRVAAKPTRSGRFYESFTIDIDVAPNNAIVYLSWEDTQVHFFVDTGADERTVEFIHENLLNGQSATPGEYAAAVEYYFFLNKDLEKALTLVNLALSKDPMQPWYYKLKVDVLEKQGNYAEALKAVYQELAFLKEHGDNVGWDEETLRVVVEDTKSRAAELTKKAKR